MIDHITSLSTLLLEKTTLASHTAFGFLPLTSGVNAVMDLRSSLRMVFLRTGRVGTKRECQQTMLYSRQYTSNLTV